MANEKNPKKNPKKYYLGLDIGTDSVGYAVTDEEYRPLKFRGEPMMGTHLIDAAKDAASRRAFRTARRRLDRKQQRVQLIRELFAPEIAKVDEAFYRRLDASALCPEDKITPNSFFDDADYKDRDYHRAYPTIHHLICELMTDPTPHDVRLVYLAVAYLVAHRGHFLIDVDKDDIEGVLDFDRIYQAFADYFEEAPWPDKRVELQEILKKKTSITAKEKALTALLFDGKKPKATEGDRYDKAALLKLLAGGQIKAEIIFLNKTYADISSVSLAMAEENFAEILSSLGDDGELLVLMKKLYDWSLLADLTAEGGMLSAAKKQVYEQHQKDLRFLKDFIRKYKGKETFCKVFRSKGKNDAGNYVSYSYHAKAGDLSDLKKADKAAFCEYILKIVKDTAVEECDRPAYEDMLARLDKNVLTFMPKQVDGDNRVIPHQLYYAELKKVLETCREYLPFLREQDGDGLTVCDKILSVFLFRIPYFIGPLNVHSPHAWIQRKADKIYPWNFEQVVDLDQSEQAFIKRMIGTCTYLPGEKVLPKNSLLYTAYTVLNEINNIEINGVALTAELKQGLFEEKFMQKTRVTVKDIRGYLISKGVMQDKDALTGLDETVKSSFKPYVFFRPFIESGKLTAAQVEDILNTKAYAEDPYRFKKWLATKYPQLEKGEISRIAAQNFKEFGRLSAAFLNGLVGTDKATGESFTVIEALWQTNNNLMQLMSDKFTFAEQAEKAAAAYYAAHPTGLSERLGEMYLPNAVKRSIIRTLDIVKDVVKAMGHAPAKVFVEMARGAAKDQKGKRTVSRREQILEFYKAFQNSNEINMLKEQLAEKEDRALRSDALYLYFTQLGKCMYTGRSINIDEITTKYNVDHIYPQCFVKDDSLSNKVLVISEENGRKSNRYPIEASIQSHMHDFWHCLKGKGLISEEKLKRLTRTAGFTEEERWAFINRQLVETRQSTKAICTLLKEQMPETEVVYVKAGMVSDFRQENDLLKARSVNDLHHAKDAYLNIVVGDVYNTVFTKRWFDPMMQENYTVNVKSFFARAHTVRGKQIWAGQASVDKVKAIVCKNNIHLTKYAYCKHGGFFNQNPAKAGKNDSLHPRKQGLDPAKYGGYNELTASYFCLVKFQAGKKSDVMLMPVELLYADKFGKDISFTEAYTKNAIAAITKKMPDNITFPLGYRPIKINSVLELDGFRVFLCGKGDGRVSLSSLMSLKVDKTWETYIKHLESFADKKKKNGDLLVHERYDKITKEQNEALYLLYAKKLSSAPFCKMPGSSVGELVRDGNDKFQTLPIEEQVDVLLVLGSVLKTGRKGGVDLSKIGGGKKIGAVRESFCISVWKKKYKTAYLVDTGASGLHEHRSQNLFELL